MSNPRKPTALKLIAGNPGKRALNAQEPHFAPCGIAAPAWLSAEAGAHWHALAPCLDANGMLSEANRQVLATYCDLLAAYIGKREAGEEPDLKLIQQLRQLAREFGFTPSSQGGIAASRKPADGIETKARFFAA